MPKTEFKCKCVFRFVLYFIIIIFCVLCLWKCGSGTRKNIYLKSKQNKKEMKNSYTNKNYRRMEEHFCNWFINYFQIICLLCVCARSHVPILFLWLAECIALQNDKTLVIIYREIGTTVFVYVICSVADTTCCLLPFFFQFSYFCLFVGFIHCGSFYYNNSNAFPVYFQRK